MGELIIVLTGVQAVIGVLLNIFFVVLAYRFVRATEGRAGRTGGSCRGHRGSGTGVPAGRFSPSSSRTTSRPYRRRPRRGGCMPAT